MSKKYQKLPGSTKRVSFDASAGGDSDAPRSSIDARRGTSSPYHAPAFTKEEEGDDEIDTLLAEDPLYEEKATKRSRKSGARLSRKSKRVIFAAVTVLLLMLIAVFTVVGLQKNAKSVTSSAPLTGDAKAQSDDLALEEIKDLTEVPTLVGNMPLPIVPALDDDDSAVEPEQIISVPPTDIDWNNEAADKDFYEAEAAKDDETSVEEPVVQSPPELSPEAIAQVQDVNGQLGEQQESITDSASKITQHKDPLESMRTAANDLLAWLQAQWSDLTSNDPTSAEEIY